MFNLSISFILSFKVFRLYFLFFVEIMWGLVGACYVILLLTGILMGFCFAYPDELDHLKAINKTLLELK